MAHVEAIYIARNGKEPMAAVAQARAIPGRGIEGDRYSEGTGVYSNTPGFREMTLIEAEAIEAAAKDYDLPLTADQTRRNIVTRGVSLNHLVGAEFTIGEVRVRGMKLAEPCNHMEELSGAPGARRSLIHRGGLRVQILNEGVIRPGDPVAS